MRKRVKPFSPTTRGEVQLEFPQRGRLHPALSCEWRRRTEQGAGRRAREEIGSWGEGPPGFVGTRGLSVTGSWKSEFPF